MFGIMATTARSAAVCIEKEASGIRTDLATRVSVPRFWGFPWGLCSLSVQLTEEPSAKPIQFWDCPVATGLPSAGLSKYRCLGDGQGGPIDNQSTDHVSGRPDY